MADRTRRRSGWSIVALVLAAIATVVAVIGVVAHYRAPGGDYVLGVSAVAPYLMLGGPLAVVLLLLGRRWWLTVVPLALTVLAVVLELPLFTGPPAAPSGPTVVTMTSNLRIGAGNPDSVVAAASRHRVDVLMLEELTPAEQTRLERAGLDRVFPYHFSRPRQYALGTGLWSRYPLTGAHSVPGFDFEFVTARARIPSVSSPVRLVALHMAGPVPNTPAWHHDIARLPSVLDGFHERTMIVGGDFNATYDVHQFREVLQDGIHDAAEQSGGGITRTWPADRWFGPLIGIDHVLTRDATATGVSTVQIPGSDHRALVANVTVPRA